MTLLTKLTCLSGNEIKQGDTSSLFRYQLDVEGRVIDGTGKAQLIKNKKNCYEFQVEVASGKVEFHFDKVLEAGTYILEIEVNGYVFPSRDTEFIYINENYDAFVEPKELVDKNEAIKAIVTDLTKGYRAVKFKDIEFKMINSDVGYVEVDTKLSSKDIISFSQLQKNNEFFVMALHEEGKIRIMSTGGDEEGATSTNRVAYFE